MHNLSDFLNGEMGTVTKMVALRSMTDELRITHLSNPDVTNVELSNRVTSLKLENEQLKTDLDNMRIELNARLSANEGLKSKISDLYAELHSAVQEKQKIQNDLTKMGNRLIVAESCQKFYQSQAQGPQVSNKLFQFERDNIQGILRQRQQAVLSINEKYEQLSADCTELLRKYQKERNELKDEVKHLRSQGDKKSSNVSDIPNTTFNPSIDSINCELAKDELKDVNVAFEDLKQHLTTDKVSKMSMEHKLNKQRILISSIADTIQNREIVENETANVFCKIQFEIDKLRIENEGLQTTLLYSKQEQSQMEDVMDQIKIELSKMIEQYELLKSKNCKAEEKILSLKSAINENKRLKKLSYEANSALIRRLRQEKQKVKALESKLYGQNTEGNFNDMTMKTEASLRECLRHVLQRNKDLRDQLKSFTKCSDESIDEGYADSSTLSSASVDIPSPAPIDTVLITEASAALVHSKLFCKPIEVELYQLRCKLTKLRQQYVSTYDE